MTNVMRKFCIMPWLQLIPVDTYDGAAASCFAKGLRGEMIYFPSTQKQNIVFKKAMTDKVHNVETLIYTVNDR